MLRNNQDGRTTLINAAIAGKTKEVKDLLKRGADVNALNKVRKRKSERERERERVEVRVINVE